MHPEVEEFHEMERAEFARWFDRATYHTSLIAAGLAATNNYGPVAVAKDAVAIYRMIENALEKEWSA